MRWFWMCLLTVGLCCEWAGAEQEWTRFRGPNGSGQNATDFPASWSADDYLWVTDLPGIGHASPVIWKDWVFVQSAKSDGSQVLLCMGAANGELIWKREYASQPYHIHARNSFASSTPAVDNEAVYFSWATPDQITLVALTHQGDLKWKRSDLGAFASQHGFGSSPVVEGDLVLLPNLQKPTGDDASKSAVIAFEKTTGETRWSTPRISGKASYSVPCIRQTPGGKEVVLCSTTHGMFGLDFATGKEVWSVDKAFAMRTVSSPVMVGDLVFGSTGSGGGGNYVVAIDMESRQIKYQIKKQAPYVPTPVARGDLLFLWYDKGMVRCIDAPSGRTHWMQRVGGNYSGSPVCAGDKVYCIAEDGTVVVLSASTTFELLGKVSLGEDSRSSPAVANGKLFLRTNSKLFCLGKS